MLVQPESLPGAGKIETAFLPIATDARLVAPLGQHVAFTLSDVEVRSRAVPMRLLVVARFEAGDMGLHHAGAHDHERVRTTASSAFPFVERELFNIRVKVGLPDPAAVKLSLGAEIVRLTGVAVLEVVGVIEDEILAGPLPQQLRKIGHGKPARRLRQAGVEKLMPRVGGQHEVTAGAPFKSLFRMLVAPDGSGAMSRDDVESFRIHVSQGRGVAARRELDDVFVGLVISVQVAQSPLDAIALARPGAQLDRFHLLDVYASHQRHALSLAPVFIRVDSYKSRLFFRIEVVACRIHNGSSYLAH